jgi:hypothetical protein
VLFGLVKSRLAQVLAHLVDVDVKRRGELDIADVIPAQVDMHQPRHGVAIFRITVVLHALHQRAGAIADADNGDPDFLAARDVDFGKLIGFLGHDFLLGLGIGY